MNWLPNNKHTPVSSALPRTATHADAPSPEHDAHPAEPHWPLGVTVAAAGVFVGMLVAKAGLYSSCAGAVCLLLVWCIYLQPAIGLWALFTTTAYFKIRSGATLPGTDIASIQHVDLLLGFLCLILLLRLFVYREKIVLTPLVTVTCLFVVWGCAMVLISESVFGANRYEALGKGKSVAYYLMALLTFNFVRTPRQTRWLAASCLATAAALGIYFVAVSLLSAPADTLVPEDLFYFASEFTRSEKCAMLWLVCTAAALMICDRPRWLYVVALGAGLAYMVVMFHRHMYGALALAAGVLLFVGYRRLGRRMVHALVSGVGLLVLVAALVAWGPSELRRYAGLTVERIGSIQTIENTASVKLRELENKYAVQTLLHSPLLGSGMARPYRPAIYGYNDELYWFIHNGYLWVALKTGLPGFLLFISMSFMFIRISFRSWPQVHDPFLRGIVLGSAVTFLALLVVNMVSPYFMQDWGVAGIGLMFGLVERIRLFPTDTAA